MILQSGLGIDITDRYVAFVLNKATFRDIKTKAHAVCLFNDNQPPESRLKTAATFINDFIQSQEITSTDIFIGIPREPAIVRTVVLPLAVKEDLRSTLTYEMEKYVPIPVGDVVFDYQILSEDKSLNQLKLLLTVIKKSDLEPYLELIRECGIGVSGLEIRSTALVNLVSSSLKTAAPHYTQTLVYIDDHGFEIDRMEGNRLTASKLIRTGIDPDTVCRRLKEEVKQPDAHGDRSDNQPLVWICGPGLNRPQGRRLTDDPDAGLQAVSPDQYRVPSQELMVAAGLAMKGVHDVTMQANLLPLQMRKRPNKIGLYTMIVLSVLVVLSGIAWGGNFYMRQRRTVDALNSEIHRLSREISSIDSIKVESDAIQQRVDYLVQLQHDSVNVLEVMKSLTLKIPETAWIKDFSFNEKGFKIDGLAESASELIPLIEDSPWFQDVAFLSAITKDKEGKERFRIGFTLTRSAEGETK